MGDPVSWNGSMPATRQQASAPKQQQPSGTDLADILERVLDKGIVIAGDIQINLLDIELLTIKLRLVVASVDKAKEMGIDWWERDPTLSSGARELEDENRRLRERLEALEQRGLPGADEDEAELADADLDDAEELDAEEVDAELADDADDADDDVHDAEEATPGQNGGTRRSSTRRRAPRREGGRR
jgi:gas vesicle protein GvpA/GvpJ/GvpM family